MDDRLAGALALLPGYLASHVALSALALLIGCVVSLPLAVAAARDARVRWPLMAATGLVQTIPSLALLALFYPLLLALSATARSLFGQGFPALGFLPSLLALSLYSMLPILRAATAALRGIDPAVLEAADSVGMTPRQRLWRIEVPLAAPVAMSGIRTAAVLTVGAATLATPIGQTSLGNYIFTGLQTEDWVSVAVGCVASAALALAADQLLGLVERGVARRDARPTAAGALGLVAGAGAALAVALAPAPATYVVGAKNFSEQFILAEAIGRRLQARGFAVQTRQGLGSAVIFRALAAGEIDAYVDYSGTLWANVLRRSDQPGRAAMNAELARALKARYGVGVLGPLGFENAYALAMRGDRARALGISDLAGLAAQSRSLRFGADLEFLGRPEWAAVERAYGLAFASRQAFTPTIMYQALKSGQADVISAFSSDGRIAADGLVVLADPKAALPPYDALLLVSPRRAGDRAFAEALRPLVGAISLDRMREANWMVDRPAGKLTPRAAAAALDPFGR